MASLAEMQAELARRGAVSQDDLLEEEFIARGLDPALLDEPQAPDGTALDLTTLQQQQPVAPQAVQEQPKEQPFFDMFGRKFDTQPEPSGPDLTGFEPLATVATAAAAELPAGLAGLASLPFVGVKGAAENVEAVQEALTFQPRTEGGKAKLQGIGEALAPIDEALKAAGAATLEATGSPELAALAETGPYMALELMGFKGASVARGSRKVVGLTDDMVSTLKKAGKTVDDLDIDDINQLRTSLLEESQIRTKRKQILESVGIDEPTRAQITRSADDFQAQQELAKTSTPVRARLERQEGQLTDALERVQARTGGANAAPTSSAIDEVTRRSTFLDQQVTQAYKLAREAAPGEKNIRFDNLSVALKKNAPSNELTGGLIKAVRGHLRQNGIIGKKFQATGRVDLQVAEEARVFINSLFDSTTPRGRGVIRELKDALDEDVFRSVPNNEFFEAARQAKIDFEGSLARAKVSKFDARKTNLVRDMVENKIAPDDFADDVVFRKKYRAEDIEQLNKYLEETPQGAQAWDDLRAQALEGIKDRVFTGPIDENNIRALSRASLERTLKNIGGAKRAKLFTPDENAFLDDLLEASKIREPVRGTALGRGPSAQAIGRVEDWLRKLPLAKMLIEIKEVIAKNGQVSKTLQPAVEFPALADRARSGLSGAAAVGGLAETVREQQQPDTQ